MQVQQRTARMLALLNVLKLHGDNLLVLTLFFFYFREIMLSNSDEKYFAHLLKERVGWGFLQC